LYRQPTVIAVILIIFISFPILLLPGDLEVTPTASSRKSKLERAKTFDLFAATQEDGGGEYIAVSRSQPWGSRSGISVVGSVAGWRTSIRDDGETSVVPNDRLGS
jgi:hypothetical protein